jgi:hypothetical protein
MSSILKVDQLQDSGGNNLITSNGSGVITAAGFGKVGQVVNAKTTTATDTTSTSFVTTNLTASITPSSTSSKILILADGCVDNDANGRQGMFALYRGSTNLSGGASTAFSSVYSTGRIVLSVALNFLDTPSTTSSTTYAIFIKTTSGNVEFCSQGTEANMTLMEILP